MATINDTGGRGGFGGFDSMAADAANGGGPGGGGTGQGMLAGGTGAATVVVRDGDGSDTIRGFSPADGIIAFDLAEIASYHDVLDRMSVSGNNTVITYDNGDALTLLGIQPTALSAANFAYSSGPVCLLAGTPIRTERGEIKIEDLRPDDIVWTKDRGWQALRLVVHEAMVFNTRDDPAKPIRIPAGALGPGQPDRDLIVSPQQRVLQTVPSSGEEVLVPAVTLIGKNGIRRMRGKRRAMYLNIVLERHSIIQTCGCWVESLLVTRRSVTRQTGAARRLLDHCLHMDPARRVERKGVRPRRLKTG